MMKDLNMPLVSIITPCYNDGDYLLDCVECVKNVSYLNIEHIIINDGSTDEKTCNILQQLEKDRELIILNKENEGVCIAKQFGIHVSKGKYILPLDADDLISRDYIEQAVGELENDQNLSLIVSDYKLFGKLNKIVELEQYSLSRLLGHNLFVNSSVFRRVDFDYVGGYNFNMKDGLEDWDLWINILKGGALVKQISGIHFFYRIKKKKQSRNANIDEVNHRQLRKIIWNNHKEAFSKVFLDPLETFEYMRIANSKEYKIGSLILKPIRKLLRK